MARLCRARPFQGQRSVTGESRNAKGQFSLVRREIRMEMGEMWIGTENVIIARLTRQRAHFETSVMEEVFSPTWIVSHKSSAHGTPAPLTTMFGLNLGFETIR